jgi:hypothetical protein
MSLVDAAIPDAGDCSDLGRWKLSSAVADAARCKLWRSGNE